MIRGVVLIVDDCDETRRALERLFDNAGYAVASASDGARGLALLSFLRRPVVAVVDERMPALSGREFVTHARRDPVTVDVPIIMVSGDENAVSTPGIYAFVRKPCDVSELLAHVARAMNELGQRR